MSEALTDSGCGETFDLKALFFELCRFCRARFRNWGCLQPDDCAEDIVSTYVLERKLRKEGRCQILGDKIVINIPNANDQNKVLHALLLFEIRNKKSNCKECKFNDRCQIAENFEAESESERRSTAVLSNPVTPEDLLKGKEMVAKILNAIPNARRRAAFAALVLEESSYKEIAERFNVNTSTVRQWFVRDRRKLRKRIARLLSGNTRGQEIPNSPKVNKFSRHQRDAVVFRMIETNDGSADAPIALELKKGAR